MKTILSFTENYARGGGNRYMIDCLNGLKYLPCELHLASNPGGVETWDTQRLELKHQAHSWPIWTATRWAVKIVGNRGMVGGWLRKAVNLLCLLGTPVFQIHNFFLFLLCLRRIRPHWVIAFNGGYPGGSSIQALCWACRWLGIPVVMSVVSQPIPNRGRERLLSILRDKLLWRTVSAVQVNAAVIANRLVMERGLPPSKWMLIPNGVSDRASRPIDPMLPPRSYSRTSADFILGFVGRIESQKGIWVLIEAVERIRRIHPGVRFELVGGGPEVDAARRECRIRGIESNVVFRGFREGPIEALLEGWDAFVFPSLQEGLPYVVLEAMRSALPIVASDVGGVPEAVRDDQEAILVRPGSVDDLTRGILKILQDGALRERLGKAARSRFLSEFTVETMHEKVARAWAPWL